MTLINIQKLNHYYGSTLILQDFSLEIKENTVVCLLGSSGSGKTTVLRLLAGFETPEKGRIIMDSQIVTDNKHLIIPSNQRDIGFIFQDLALWPHMTVFDNIAFGLNEKKAEDVSGSVFKILDYFDLRDHAKKYPHQLSGGQKQLVAISRSLVLEPKILLMDEPLANLDVKLKQKILDHIKSLRKDFKLTIVYVTHDHKEAFTLADQIVVINRGRIEEVGTVAQLKSSNNTHVKYFLDY